MLHFVSEKNILTRAYSQGDLEVWMRFLLCKHTVWVILLVLLGALLTSCTPDANAEIISPELGARLTAAEANAQVVAQPTPVPLKLAELSQEQILAGLPEEVAASMANAKPENGQSLSLTNGCIGCHSLDPNQQMAGPTWHNIGDTAANRQAGVSPANYLYASITNPNAYMVDGYLANVMPANFGEKLSAQDLADIIRYLLDQHRQ
jgi:cytochrome c551/c552